MVYKSNALASGGSSGTGGGSISTITSSGGTIAITNPTGPTTNIDANVATSLVAGIVQPDNATITISGGVITAVTGGSGTVTNVSGVTANGFAFSISNPTTTPAITVKTTANGILQGNGTAISAVTTGIAGRLLVDQGSASAAFEVASGDVSCLSTGAFSVLQVHGVAYPASPGTNTVPVVTGSNQVTYEQVPNAALLNSAITVGAGAGLTGGGSVPLGGATTLSLTNNSVTVSGVSGVTGGGAVALGSSITLGMAGNTANTIAGYNSSGVFSDISIGSNLSLSGGILNGTVGPAAVTSVFSRTGAVTAQWNDYNFNLIGGTATASQGGTGLSTLTAHAVMLGEGVANVSFATTGTAGRLLIDQGNADPKFQIITGDVSALSTGAITVSKVNSVAYPASPGTNTVPVVTGSNQVTYETVPNAALANSAITIGAQTGLAGGGSVALGSAITMSMGTNTANTLAGYNSSGIFSDVSIGTNLNLVSGVLATSNFSQGSGISITYSTNTVGIATSAAAGVSTISNTDGGSLTITPNAGAVTANLNVGHANTWTATQTSAVSGGVTSFISQGCIEFSIFANGNSGAGTPTLKWDNGNIQTVTITGACTLGFTNPTYPGRLTVISTMSATSNFTYAFAGTVLWPGGTHPTLSSVTNAIDISSFIWDGTHIFGISNSAFS